MWSFRRPNMEMKRLDSTGQEECWTDDRFVCFNFQFWVFNFSDDRDDGQFKVISCRNFNEDGEEEDVFAEIKWKTFRTIFL